MTVVNAIRHGDDAEAHSLSSGRLAPGRLDLMRVTSGGHLEKESPKSQIV